MLTRQELNNILKYIKPRNIETYKHVFNHKSTIRKNNESSSIQQEEEVSNERLEFLGDAVLNIIVTEWLYDQFPDRHEGFLTKVRIKIVKGTTLTQLAKYLNLDQYIRVSYNTKINEHIMENTFEALVAAVYLDYRPIGIEMEMVRLFIRSILNDALDLNELLYDDNYKDMLMRYTQTQKYSAPVYIVMEINGKSHKPIFTIMCRIETKDGQIIEKTSQSETKKQAEQDTAKLILEHLGWKKDDFVIN